MYLLGRVDVFFGINLIKIKQVWVEDKIVRPYKPGWKGLAWETIGNQFAPNPSSTCGFQIVCACLLEKRICWCKAGIEIPSLTRAPPRELVNQLPCVLLELDDTSRVAAKNHDALDHCEEP